MEEQLIPAMPLEAVLMDTWYAAKEIMLLNDGMKKTFYCPLRSNRQVDDSGVSVLTSE